MSAFKDDKDRKVIPRWRSVSRALALREFDPLPRLAVGPTYDANTVFEEKLSEWTNPQAPLLLNNLAFALANIGEVHEARRAISKISSRDDDQTVQICKLATTGLIEFRSARPDIGRKLYVDAIDKAKSAQMKRLTARASILYALEEIRAKSTFAEGALQSAELLSSGIEDADTKHLRDRLLKAAGRDRPKVVSPFVG